MQIKIDLKIFIFLIIFVLTKQIELYSWFMIFALVHELAHMLAGILSGLKAKALHIMPFGFTIVFESSQDKKIVEVKKLIIALAGPTINICIFIISLVFKLPNNIIYSNLLLALFNIIPIYPLDGGRIIKSILTIKRGDRSAHKIINKISNITIIFLTALVSITILYLKNIAILVILAYLWVIVIRENKKYNLLERIYNIIEKNNENIDNKQIKCENEYIEKT